MDQNSGLFTVIAYFFRCSRIFDFILDGVYLQKGIIVLVIAMLLTIPNMHMYSFVGSYQTLSPALTANTNYKFSHSIEKPEFPAFGIITLFGVVIASGIALISVALDDDHSIFATPTLPSKIIDENHVEYNFSQFDN